MLTLLRDKHEFVVAAAILGTGLAVLNLAYSADWGWIPALVMLPALAVRAVWRSMPSWLLLLWVAVPVVAGEAMVKTPIAYLVLVVAIVVVTAYGASRLDTMLIVLCVLSPFALWILAPSDWNHDVGAWTWACGLVIGWIFGSIIGQQWQLIAELERTRDALAEAAVADERQRIARELHDLVGHNFAVVLLHLSGARMILDTSPDEAVEALRRAEDVGRQGMEELRQALVLMRDGTETTDVVTQGDIKHLVDVYCRAGMDVAVQVEGDVESVAGAPGIVLHDVIRESLTNVAKHADEPSASLQIRCLHDEIVIRVESPLGLTAVGSDGPDVGSGLAGLEQRVDALGGRFDAGPAGDRWVVEAAVPTRLVELRA
jgi:signal transduction histidine kinase